MFISYVYLIVRKRPRPAEVDNVFWRVKNFLLKKIKMWVLSHNLYHTCGLFSVHWYISLFVWLPIVCGCLHAVTEGSSEFSDSDLDIRYRRSYRSRKQQVNYCESSDTDGSQASTNRDKKKRRRLSSSDSEGQCHLYVQYVYSQHKTESLYIYIYP